MSGSCDIAWAAGLFEGKGRISRRNRGERVDLTLQVISDQWLPLLLIAVMWGGLLWLFIDPLKLYRKWKAR